MIPRDQPPPLFAPHAAPSKHPTYAQLASVLSDDAKRAATHRAQIRHHLAMRGSITPQDAMMAYGCYRLAARIHELRAEGINIETIRHPGGGTEYRVQQEPA